MNSQEQISAILGRLERYVRLETPTGDKAALDALADELAADFAALGATVTRDVQQTGDHLVIELPGRGAAATLPPLLFLTHHDTVWPHGQLAQMPLRRDGDTLYGPGTFDMKAGIAVLVEALLECERHLLLHRPVRVLVIADEEIGSPSARALIERQQGQVAYALGLEPPHPDGAVKTSRWGSSRLRLSVRGVAAHAALDPDKGVSAIDELVDQLLWVRQVLADYPEVLCNVGTLAGGGRTNVVAEEATAELGLRFRDAVTEASVLALLACPAPVRDGAQVTTTLLSNRPAWTPAAVHEELLGRLVTAAATVEQRLTGAPAAGAADTNRCGWLGIPTVDGLGPVGRGAHALEEQLSVASLASRTQLLVAIIHAL